MTIENQETKGEVKTKNLVFKACVRKSGGSGVTVGEEGWAKDPRVSLLDRTASTGRTFHKQRGWLQDKKRALREKPSTFKGKDLEQPCETLGGKSTKNALKRASNEWFS